MQSEWSMSFSYSWLVYSCSRFEPTDSSQDVLATTMKIVEEKQKAVKKMFAQHGIPVHAGSTSENLRKAAELQAKIQAQLKDNPALVS